ncbi:MAG TPA: aminotransferase class I/II-fold pyridoxal phosphate-dependent enzyme, partial [Bacillota bacterium]|nr:aminotransferase class I/II-fold pyridoxal phosphate-dependent enzyme [Bacillota bacterium]
MAARKNQVEAGGLKVINLGIGSPDLPPADHIKEALIRGIENNNNYTYPVFEGRLDVRESVAKWYFDRFGVTLDPKEEVLMLMGSQDGLAHLAWSYINPGDVALVPDPGYPIYFASILLAGGKIATMPLYEAEGFLPDFSRIPE